MHALRHLAVVKAQQKEFALAMDVRDAADRLCEDQRLSAERAVLDDPRSISDITTLLAKQGRELGELRARHRATRARLDREVESWNTRGVFFPGPAKGDERRADPPPRLAASSPAPRALAAPAPAVTPSWGAFRTPAEETRRHAGTATKAFLEAGGVWFDSGAGGDSSRFPEAASRFPIRALDFGVSDAGDGTASGRSTAREHHEPPLPDTREPIPAIPGSVWSQFGRRRTWLRRPSATVFDFDAVAAAGARSPSSSSPAGRASLSPFETTKTRGLKEESTTKTKTEKNTTTAVVSQLGYQMQSRAALLSIPRLTFPAGEKKARAAEREDWRGVSLGAPVDVAPPTAADDWRSLAMMRARDPGTRAAAARAYGEYRDALDVVSSNATDPRRATNRGFADAASAESERRKTSFLARRDRSYSSDLVGFDDRENAQDEAWTRRGPTGPTGRRASGRIEDVFETADEQNDAEVWTRNGASLRRAAGVGRTRRRSANAPLVAVDASASFVQEALRPLDDERIREEDARVRPGGGAKGRVPTGAFFETRRGTLADANRRGASLPSNRTKHATPVSVRT